MSDAQGGAVVRGRVTDVLPRGLFSIRTDDGPVTAGMGREAAHVVRVKPGLRWVDANVEILSGVKEGDRVIIQES